MFAFPFFSMQMVLRKPILRVQNMHSVLFTSSHQVFAKETVIFIISKSGFLNSGWNKHKKIYLILFPIALRVISKESLQQTHTSTKRSYSLMLIVSSLNMRKSLQYWKLFFAHRILLVLLVLSLYKKVILLQIFNIVPVQI